MDSSDASHCFVVHNFRLLEGEDGVQSGDRAIRALLEVTDSCLFLLDSQGKKLLQRGLENASAEAVEHAWKGAHPRGMEGYKPGDRIVERRVPFDCIYRRMVRVGFRGYDPRIWHEYDHTHFPNFDHLTRYQVSKDDYRILLDYLSQIGSLLKYLDDICETAYPYGVNLQVYGREIRNLFLLSCTEVESMWKSALSVHGYSREKWTTNDYVKLACPMKLADFSVEFIKYPGVEVTRPFLDWREGGKPTQDLPWYASHHGIKHDRVTNFPQASLARCFEAIAACIIMCVAQFGIGSIEKLTDYGKYLFIEIPRWDLDEFYILSRALLMTKDMKYPFGE